MNSTPISGDRRVPKRVCEGYEEIWLSLLSKKVRKSTLYMNFCALTVHEISISKVEIFSLCVININKTERHKDIIFIFSTYALLKLKFHHRQMNDRFEVTFIEYVFWVEIFTK